jgi:hypothetical protein
MAGPESGPEMGNDTQFGAYKEGEELPPSESDLKAAESRVTRLQDISGGEQAADEDEEGNRVRKQAEDQEAA